MILKVQKPPCWWEFYICHELRERLKSMNAITNVLDSFMRVNRGYFSPQGSILVSEYHKYGTLLDIVNSYKSSGKSVPEIIVFFFMIELLTAVKALHSCHIIHGDLKPDNVILRSKPEINMLDSGVEVVIDGPSCVKLIDFGRSIDMKLLPGGSTFTKKVTTDGFTICEMKDGKPWTYQTDYFGLAAIAHILLWGTYMKVKKDGQKWGLTGVHYQRYWKRDFWTSFFHKMLNIPSCSQIPDIGLILEDFKEVYKMDAHSIEKNIKNLCSIMMQKSK